MREKDLKHIISQLSRSEVDALLSKLVLLGGKNLEIFLAETEGKVERNINKKANEDIKRAFEDAKEAFESYDDEDYGWIDYGRGPWDERCVNLEGEDVEDYLESVKSEMYPLRDLLKKYSDVAIDDSLRKEIYSWALDGMQNFYSDNVADDAFDELFISILKATIRSKEDALALAEDLSEIDSYIGNKEVVKIYSEYGFVDKEIEMRISKCTDSKTLLDIIDRLNSLGRIEEGIHLARKWYMDHGSSCRDTELGEYVLNSYKNDERALEDFIDAGGFFSNMYEKLYEHFKKEGNYKRQKEYLLRLARTGLHEYWFEILEKELRKDDWEKERGNLISYYRECDPTFYAKISLNDGNYKEVLDLLKNGKISDENYYFSFALAEQYPLEIYSLLLEDARFNVENESYRSEYEEALAELHALKKIARRNNLLLKYKKDLEKIIEDNPSRKKFVAKIRMEELLEID